MLVRAMSSALLSLALLLVACTGAADGGAITVSDARVPVPAGANGAAYLTLANDGEVADRLTAAATDAAEAVEIHETSLDDGSMAMRQVDSVEVPAGGTAVLEPGGLHLMLVGVTTDLEDGDTVTLTLTFARAGEQTVDAEVVPPGGGMRSEEDIRPGWSPTTGGRGPATWRARPSARIR